MNEIKFLGYMFWPCGVAILILLLKKEIVMKLAAGLTLVFSAVLWIYIQKITSNNPGYMIPAWHIMYPWFCLVALVVFSILFRLSGWFVGKTRSSEQGSGSDA